MFNYISSKGPIDLAWQQGRAVIFCREKISDLQIPGELLLFTTRIVKGLEGHLFNGGETLTPYLRVKRP
jgi:hypothetical protein